MSEPSPNEFDQTTLEVMLQGDSDCRASAVNASTTIWACRRAGGDLFGAFFGSLLAPRKPARVGSNAPFEDRERLARDRVLTSTHSGHRSNGLGLSGGSNFFSHHAGRFDFHAGTAGR